MIGVSINGEERKRVAPRIRPYFRFRWLDNSLLSYIAAGIEQDVEQYLAGPAWALHHLVRRNRLGQRVPFGDREYQPARSLRAEMQR